MPTTPATPATPAAAAAVAAAAPVVLDMLAAQEAVSGQVRQVANERHAAVVAADLRRLGELVNRERTLVSRLGHLEDARLEALRPVASELGLPVEGVTLSHLSALADAPTAAALQATRDRVLDRVQEVAAGNRRNSGLLQACLESVNTSIQHLLQAAQPDPRYASNGHRVDQQSVPRLTDVRA